MVSNTFESTILDSINNNNIDNLELLLQRNGYKVTSKNLINSTNIGTNIPRYENVYELILDNGKKVISVQHYDSNNVEDGFDNPKPYIKESLKESYTIVAYDKDNDVYNDLDKFDDLDRAIEDAKFYYERLTNPKFLEGEEPIDWIEIEDANGKVVWASYDSLKEGGVGSGNRKTSSQRYNDKMDKIWQNKKNLVNAQAKYLLSLGVSEEEVNKLRADDKLQVKIENGKVIDKIDNN